MAVLCCLWLCWFSCGSVSSLAGPLAVMFLDPTATAARPVVPGTTGWARITSVRAVSRVREVGMGAWDWGSVGGLAGLAPVEL